ncbi:MAG: GNAT family N-acetyltransferase [Dehalococcoidia bacterium]|nr:GNAT family N-acetyltransferase [Dehalococcoidia bacterium]
MNEPTYRQATIHDADAVASIINTVVQEPDPVGFDGPTTPDQVRTWLTRQGGEGGIFLCMDDGTVIGFSALDFDTHEPDTAVLGVWLLREHRRKGLGTALAEYALGFARDKGFKRIRGRLPEHNETALSFLSGIGALVPMYNPEAVYELPLYEEDA